jgi:phthalate 4,5-dioxygenase oxygenase subunit
MRAEDNEALTRVGAGTVMGALLRQYWLPILLSPDIDTPGAPPQRVRILGEDLIAFRDGGGSVGLIGERCPHRGASLYFGRSEADGLRCAYHGWKFGRDGRCRDMPNEPADCGFAERVRTLAYPCRERNGVVWAYLGPRPDPPPLPELEWNLLPGNPPFVWRSLRPCNWLQALEGDLDSSHVAVLHATFDDPGAPTVPGTRMPGGWSDGMRLVRTAQAPRIAAVDTPYGALYSAYRALDAERDYHRVHPFLLPFHTMVGGSTGTGPSSFNGKVWLPVDDTHTLVLEWHLRPAAPWSDDERRELARVRYPHGFLPATGAAWSAFRSPAHVGNDHLRDRSLESSRQMLGILSNPLQDAAIQESMGPIIDRTREHLGPADAMIVRVRRRLLAAARALSEHGTAPPGVDQPALYRVRPVGAVLPRDADWLAATQARREAFGG